MGGAAVDLLGAAALLQGLAALQMVPAVSMMSSTMMQVLSLTSPMMCMTSDTFDGDGVCR